MGRNHTQKKSRILVIAEDEEHVEEAILRLGRISFDHVEGFLKDGMSRLKDHSELWFCKQNEFLHKY